MRKRLTYTKSDIETGLYTAGGEFQLENGTEYTGLYHRYIDGGIMTGDVYNKQSSRTLVPFNNSNNEKDDVYFKLRPNILKTYETPIMYIPKPGNVSSFTRYFLKVRNFNTLFEVNKETYTKWQQQKIDPILYDGTKLTWKTSGPLHDQIQNGALLLGVINSNKFEVVAANEKLPGLFNKIQNYTEFYVSPNIKVPKDLNE